MKIRNTKYNSIDELFSLRGFTNSFFSLPFLSILSIQFGRAYLRPGPRSSRTAASQIIQLVAGEAKEAKVSSLFIALTPTIFRRRLLFLFASIFLLPVSLWAMISATRPRRTTLGSTRIGGLLSIALLTRICSSHRYCCYYYSLLGHSKGRAKRNAVCQTAVAVECDEWLLTRRAVINANKKALNSMNIMSCQWIPRRLRHAFRSRITSRNT